ncbi:mechanosensitive ion channel [Spirulina subsalsa FACHB-351]|uniref:Mechanosensitive ion channel n=1 Tax=Spirulina subsalsa FACHB-351 TaxID=234711 RepID=A0ABT3LAQ4_9CYAN|nr:mechanosensitive ion channel domain-containing protein [Spirulina subsalsa]MCW6038565.1 mechanosensitive ion channel [Spirulina subsalsa FACHB-351]
MNPDINTMLQGDALQQLWLQVQSVLTTFGIKLLVAIIVLFIGLRIAKIIQKATRRALRKAEVDETLISFAVNLTYFGALVFVFIIVLGQLGIQTTAIIAALTSGFLAVGLALQGSLSNFAAGVLLVMFRPFRVGDYIEGAGTGGVVEDIQIFTTILTTPDNKSVVIPNASLTGGNIINYSAKPIRRLDMVFGVSYSDDLSKVKQAITEVLEAEERVLAEPNYTIGLLELADSSVNFAVRPYVKTSDYWPTYFALQEAMKRRFDAEGINIPFPQRDVHIYNS